MCKFDLVCMVCVKQIVNSLEKILDAMGSWFTPEEVNLIPVYAWIVT